MKINLTESPPTWPELEEENLNNSFGVQYPSPVHCQPIHKVAILLPYRDRDRNLRILLHHLHPMLKRQQLYYGIYVIEQVNS